VTAFTAMTIVSSLAYLQGLEIVVCSAFEADVPPSDTCPDSISCRSREFEREEDPGAVYFYDAYQMECVQRIPRLGNLQLVWTLRLY